MTSFARKRRDKSDTGILPRKTSERIEAIGNLNDEYQLLLAKDNLDIKWVRDLAHRCEEERLHHLASQVLALIERKIQRKGNHNDH